MRPDACVLAPSRRLAGGVDQPSRRLADGPLRARLVNPEGPAQILFNKNTTALHSHGWPLRSRRASRSSTQKGLSERQVPDQGKAARVEQDRYLPVSLPPLTRAAPLRESYENHAYLCRVKHTKHKFESGRGEEHESQPTAGHASRLIGEHQSQPMGESRSIEGAEFTTRGVQHGPRAWPRYATMQHARCMVPASAHETAQHVAARHSAHETAQHVAARHSAHETAQHVAARHSAARRGASRMTSLGLCGRKDNKGW